MFETLIRYIIIAERIKKLEDTYNIVPDWIFAG